MITTLNRTFVIASNTFTQLVRMKALWFLAAFTILLLVMQFVKLPTGRFDISAGEDRHIG